MKEPACLLWGFNQTSRRQEFCDQHCVVCEERFTEKHAGWFEVSQSSSTDSSYHHFHAIENVDTWDCVRETVANYFQSAHADAQQRLQNLASGSLHPGGSGSPAPYAKYPCSLPEVTLQGYFGEILSAWFAENECPSKISGWQVPAYLFRNQLCAFQYLERLSQTGSAPSAIVGRTGDDCLAFQRDAEGVIVSVLFCEAKCTLSHNASLIRDAHVKAGDGAIADIPQLIEVLLARDDEEAIAWVDALRELHLKLHQSGPTVIDRHDLVCYVHSQIPKQKSSWIPIEQCHDSYTAGRTLNAYEVRLDNVSRRLHDVYDPEAWP